MLAILLPLAPACGVDNPDFLRDSTGVEIGWECDLGRCQPFPESFTPDPPDCGAETELLVGSAGLAILCAVTVDESGRDIVHEATCRPLVCAVDFDCPQWSARAYACEEGFCHIDVDGWALDALDHIALCLADVPRHESCAEAEADPIVAERVSAALEGCEGSRCTYPSICPDPF